MSKENQKICALYGHCANAGIDAGTCLLFDELMASGKHSMTTAARKLGRSVSWFSGENSRYARFKRDGFKALVSARMLKSTAKFIQ